MQENKRNGIGLGILIGILIMLVIGMGSYIIYDKVLKNNNYNEENKEEQKEQQDIPEDLDVNSELVQQLYSYTDTFCRNNRKFFYENNKLLMNDLKNEYKLYLAMSNMIRDNNLDLDDDNPTNYPLKKFEDSMNKVFGSNVSYIKEKTLLFPDLEFNNDDVVIYSSAGCGVGAWYERKLVLAKKYSDRIEIDEKNIYVVAGAGIDGGPGIFKEYTENIENPFVKEVYSENNESYVDKYEKDLPTYRYTYNIDDQGNYYLYSVEKINN